MNERERALLFDDDPGTLGAIKHELECVDFRVSATRDVHEAWSSFSQRSPDLVVVKLTPSRLDAVRLVRRIRGEAGSWVPIVVAVADRRSETVDSVFAAGQEAATHLLQLPRDLARLGPVAREVAQLDVHHLRERRRRLLYHDLRRTLQECNGVIAQVAERMGADRNTIYYHLKKFGLY